ncbi:uncharacterized protein LOC134263849 [Saccostrea cucullata]|uniref:uncharacterized protein LOC134263849 n=1 Tax=Saccostrea cuccullata TaxID=36930 RepID=UPI002ED5C24B
MEQVDTHDGLSTDPITTTTTTTNTSNVQPKAGNSGNLITIVALSVCLFIITCVLIILAGFVIRRSWKKRRKGKGDLGKKDGVHNMPEEIPLIEDDVNHDSTPDGVIQDSAQDNDNHNSPTDCVKHDTLSNTGRHDSPSGAEGQVVPLDGNNHDSSPDNDEEAFDQCTNIDTDTAIKTAINMLLFKDINEKLEEKDIDDLRDFTEDLLSEEERKKPRKDFLRCLAKKIDLKINLYYLQALLLRINKHELVDECAKVAEALPITIYLERPKTPPVNGFKDISLHVNCKRILTTGKIEDIRTQLKLMLKEPVIYRGGEKTNSYLLTYMIPEAKVLLLRREILKFSHKLLALDVDFFLLDGMKYELTIKGSTLIKMSEEPFANECRIVLIGKTGSGKSATGNTILGEKYFSSNISVTNKCKLGIAKRFGRDLRVIDTPGLFDTGASNEFIHREISKCIALSSPGAHAFVIVLSIGRYTIEEETSINHFVNHFGEEIYRYFILLFTRKDALDEDNVTLEQYLNSMPESFTKFFEKLDRRFIAFNNREELQSPASNEQVKNLLCLIESNVVQNAGRVFSNKDYHKAELNLKDRELELRKQKEWEIAEQKEKYTAETEGKFFADFKELQKRIQDFDAELKIRKEILKGLRHKEIFKQQRDTIQKKVMDIDISVDTELAKIMENQDNRYLLRDERKCETQRLGKDVVKLERDEVLQSTEENIKKLLMDREKLIREYQLRLKILQSSGSEYQALTTWKYTQKYL